LHCGRYLGEPDEETWVRGWRAPPPTSIPATEFTPTFQTIDRPSRKWILGTRALLFIGVCLLVVGGLIAALLIHNAGEVTVDLLNNNRLTVLTPTPNPTPLQTLRSTPVRTSSAERTPLDMVREEPIPKTESAPATQPRTQTLVDQTFAVNAGQFYYFKFSVPSRARVAGRFEAHGGANDIAAAIIDEDGFANYSSRHAFRSYYSSPYMTVDNVNVVLNPGTYYLTFDNRKDLITAKTVTA